MFKPNKYIPTFLQTKAFICRTYAYSSNYASDIDRHSSAYLCTKTFTYTTEYTRYISNSSRTTITLRINVDKYIPTYKIYRACIPRFFYPRTRKSAPATVTSQEVPVPLEDQARQAIHLQTNQPADRSRLKRFGVHAAKKNLDTNVLLKLRADSHCAKDARYKLTAMLAKSSDEPME